MSELVYFVRSGDMVKIGRTRDLAARLRALRTGNPKPLRVIGTTPGGAQLETIVHRACSHVRVIGEWFHLTDPQVSNLLQLLADVRAYGFDEETVNVSGATIEWLRRVVAPARVLSPYDMDSAA